MIMEVLTLLFVTANRLTVAVSDVLNPNIDDMSRGVGHLGYGGIQGDFSPQVGSYPEQYYDAQFSKDDSSKSSWCRF